ncbi:MAG: serine/threonine-protein kinase, partial [Phycicoccus sp.]
NSAYGLMPRIRAVPVPTTGRADVPVTLERHLSHAMAKNPDVRPQSALEFARGLQAVEQSQRLPRTPVVVLDEQGNTTVTAMPAGRTADDHDRTSVRAVSVTPHAPVVTPPQPAGPAEREDTGPTTVSGGVVLAVLGILVAGLVGVLVWALGENGGSVGAQPSASQRTRTEPPTSIVDPPGQPVLDARPVSGAVTFTWNYENTESEDFFRLQIGPEEGSVEDAPVTTVQGRSAYTVRAAAGARVCARVAVSRKEGMLSTVSAVRCETAG